MTLPNELLNDMLKIITSEDIFNKMIDKFDVDALPAIEEYMTKLHKTRNKLEFKKFKQEFRLGKSLNDWTILKPGDNIVHISYYSGRRVSFLKIFKVIISKKYHDILASDDEGDEVYCEPDSPRILDEDEIIELRKTGFQPTDEYYYDFDFKYKEIGIILQNYKTLRLYNHICRLDQADEACDRKKYKLSRNNGEIDKIYIMNKIKLTNKI